MARLPRLAVSGFVHHLMVRSSHGQNLFMDGEDRECLLAILGTQLRNWRVALHGVVLLPNQVQLLVTPSTEIGIPKLMQALGRQYASAFNRRHGRRGTLWEGRYRSLILEPEAYLLECMVWMDTQPVRQQLSSSAKDFTWSSCAHHLGLKPMPFLTSHAQYWALGNTPFAREAAYAQLLERGLGAQASERWAAQADKGWVMGSEDFVQELEKLTPRRLQPGKPGRPRKAVSRNPGQ